MGKADLIFPHLALWIDPTPRAAAENMAVDELLFRSAPPQPVLRFYRWLRPAFSFGYFQKWETIQPFLPPGVEAVRRWTGGGLVDHRHDVTYTLIIPASQGLAKTPSRDLYRMIHERLAGLLRDAGHACGLAPARNEPPSAIGRCFAGGHAEHDILSPGGKISGAAQRRHRLGILHQGSLAVEPLPDTFPARFAASLAAATFALQATGIEESGLAALTQSRYAAPEWRHLR